MNDADFATIVNIKQRLVDDEMNAQAAVREKAVSELYAWAVEEFKNKRLCNIYRINVSRPPNSELAGSMFTSTDYPLYDVDLFAEINGGWYKFTKLRVLDGRHEKIFDPWAIVDWFITPAKPKPFVEYVIISNCGYGDSCKELAAFKQKTLNHIANITKQSLQNHMGQK